MVVRIELKDGYSNDLVAYFDAWEAGFTYRGHGQFDSATQPYDQWSAGKNGETGVLLNGDGFTYTQANFNGDIKELVFGGGFTSGGGTSASTLATQGLVIDLTDATLTQAFTYSIYILSNYGTVDDTTVWGTPRPGLYSYFDEQGTEQVTTDGNDTLYGFAGEDTFIFESTTIGTDVIKNFESGVDTIEFDTSVFANFAAVSAAASASGSNVLITHSVGNTITIENFTLAQLDASDFSFV